MQRTSSGRGTGLAPVPSDILGALDELGIGYQVSGEDAKIICPWHDDHSPSCYVHLRAGVTNCFVCGESGQFHKLVRTVLGGTRERAVLWCQTRSAGRLRSSADLSRAPDASDTSRQINEASLALFTNPPDRALGERGISLDACRELGILWDATERAWVLPMRDQDGTLRGWQLKKGHDVWNHPRGLRKAEFLFGLSAGVNDTGVLVESPLDVAVFRTAGHCGGIASYGVRVSAAQLDLIPAYFSELVVALDNDHDGREVSGQLRREYHRLPVRFFDYGGTKCKDPGEMWLAGEDILRGIDRAIPSLTARF